MTGGDMKISIGSDHAGYHYKEMIKQFLEEKGYAVQDFGTHSDKSVDYPPFIRAAAVAVQKGECDRGIVLGGSGNGEAMVANRLPGIRCALCWNRETALLARGHNDANVLSLGARMISSEMALEIVDVWLNTPFDGGRHVKRIQQIDEAVTAKGKTGPESKDETPVTGETSRAAGEGPEPQDAEKYDLLIAFRYIKYIEGRDSIEFQVDPGLKTPTVIHIPSPERWRSEVTDWARDRRDEILGRIKEKTAHMKPEFKEY
jgi:ribose 5-phosphate isomerase B